MSRVGGMHGMPLVVIDYAHTPDALEQALAALRAHCAGRLICVFGCGGERDAGKRPLMGEIAARLADVAIVTDDNPRGEDGDLIVAQIVAGMAASPSMAVERDRAKAIGQALQLARAGDVLLIAGKGHETYQETAAGKPTRMMRLSAIAMWAHGSLRGADADVSGVAIDSRKVQPGNLFVAIKGEHSDGHAHLADAAARGASAALVSRAVESPLPQVLVKDVTLALGDLASAARARQNARVVGITGSNGKTTVKTLVASILSRHGRTHVSAGNYNNELGLPLTLLMMPDDTEFAVLEMGAGKPGDIDYLAAIARPDIGLVTLIAPAHLERMGSVEGVADTKGAIYQALPADGIAIINADDAFANFFSGLAGSRRVLRFGLDHPADVGADIIEQTMTGSHFVLSTPQGDSEVRLPLTGRHNVANALAASAVALALDIPLDAIVAGLEQASGVSGRLRCITTPGGWTLIDDSYNANPSSMLAAIDTLMLAAGERWLVIGDMAELGADARSLHADVGARARERGVDRLFAVGPLATAAVEGFGKEDTFLEWDSDADGHMDRNTMMAMVQHLAKDNALALGGPDPHPLGAAAPELTAQGAYMDGDLLWQACATAEAALAAADAEAHAAAPGSGQPAAAADIATRAAGVELVGCQAFLQAAATHETVRAYIRLHRTPAGAAVPVGATDVGLTQDLLQVLVSRHLQLYGPSLEHTFASTGVSESRLRQQRTVLDKCKGGGRRAVALVALLQQVLSCAGERAMAMLGVDTLDSQGLDPGFERMLERLTRSVLLLHGGAASTDALPQPHVPSPAPGAPPVIMPCMRSVTEADLAAVVMWGAGAAPMVRREQQRILANVLFLHDLVRFNLRDVAAPLLARRRGVRHWAQVWRGNALALSKRRYGASSSPVNGCRLDSAGLWGVPPLRAESQQLVRTPLQSRGSVGSRVPGASEVDEASGREGGGTGEGSQSQADA
ncbi:MAG: hypothetical protein WDW36_005093 [Sanguina aurantia]